MPILFHFPRSLSSAAVQVVSELEAPVEVRTLNFGDGQFSYAGKPAPLPTGGMGLIGPVRSCPTYREDALTLIQCTAIIERLCDRFDPNNTLRPADASGRARHLSLMVFAEATLFPVVQFLSPPGSPNDNAREQMRRDRFEGLLAPFLESELDSNAFLCGASPSACDFLIGMPCLNNAFNAGVLTRFPQLLSYFERLRERDSFRLAHGNPDDGRLNRELGAMVATAHGDAWDFTYRAKDDG